MAEQHPHLKKTKDFAKGKNAKWYNKVNSLLAVRITGFVGTMWCAYIFALISLSSLKSTLALHSVNADVQWVAQTFLQLVLLSIILVGQNVSSKASDERAIKTYEDTEYLKLTQQEQHDKLDRVLEILDGSKGSS